MKRARGFSLVEVLLATVLLAAGLTLAFATLTGATAGARRGEEIAQQSTQVRGVENFLRRRIAAARAIAFATDESSNLPVRFEGDATRMRFVSDLPDYIGRGGPSLHELYVERGAQGEGLRLMLGLSVAQGVGVQAPSAADESAKPEVLASKLRGVRFRYRSLGPDAQLTDWMDEWEATEQLPLLVEIDVTAADGRRWPLLVVAPRLASAYNAAGAAL